MDHAAAHGSPPADNPRTLNSLIRLVRFIQAYARVSFPPMTTEEQAMLTRNDPDRFASRVLAGLAVSIAMVLASLTHAVVTSQAFV